MPILRRLARFAAVLAVAAPALSAAATVRDVEILFDPAVPTWRDEVTVTVRGEADCAVTGVEALPFGLEVELRLEEACIIDPPSFQPFGVSTNLGRLSPARQAVRVMRPDLPNEVAAEAELAVYDVADLVIAPPQDPPTDAAPFRFTVSGFSPGCVPIEPAEVVGDVIRVEFPDDCPILPPVFVREHEIEVGPLPAGEYEIHVFRHFVFAEGFQQVAKSTIQVYDDELCVPSPTELCLSDDRFLVSVEWRDFFGGSGSGQAVPFRTDTGFFWFFDDANVELTVKVLAACPVDGHHWVFVASGSTVEYTVTVTDTLTDESRTYENGLGEVPELIADTAAFVCP